MNKIFVGVIDIVVIFVTENVVYAASDSLLLAFLGMGAIGAYSAFCFTDGFNRASSLYDKYMDR